MLSEILCCVGWYKLTDMSEVLTASIIRRPDDAGSGHQTVRHCIPEASQLCMVRLPLLAVGMGLALCNGLERSCVAVYSSASTARIYLWIINLLLCALRYICERTSSFCAQKCNILLTI